MAKFKYDKSIKSQVSFINDDSRYVLFLGGRGSGKSYSAAIKTIKNLCNKNSVGIVVAPNYKQLVLAQSTLFELMYNNFEYSAREGLSLTAIKRRVNLPAFLISYNKQDKELTTIFNSKLYFRSADNPDSLRGFNLNFAWLDEAAYFDEEAVKNIDLCLRLKNAQMYLSTTPKGFNWLYDTKDKYNLYKAKTTDNHFLPKEFIDSLPKEGSWYEQEVNAEFTQMSGLVYTDYTIEELNKYSVKHTTAGMDFGYSHPASVIYTALIDCEYGRDCVYVYKELYATEMTTDDMYDRLKEINFQELDRYNYKFWGYYADPSLPGNIEELRRKSLLITKANNDIVFGIDRVKRHKLIIHPSCVNLIKEISNYTWNENGKPNKVNDHALDAMRYGIVALLDNNEIKTDRVLFNDNDDALYRRLGI